MTSLGLFAGTCGRPLLNAGCCEAPLQLLAKELDLFVPRELQ